MPATPTRRRGITLLAALLTIYTMGGFLLALRVTVERDERYRWWLIASTAAAFAIAAGAPNEELAATHHITASAQQTRVATDRLQKVAELVDQGVLTPAIDKTFPLEQAAEALEYMRRGHHRGKVVINVAD